jgi:hypothetical protein
MVISWSFCSERKDRPLVPLQVVASRAQLPIQKMSSDESLG